MSTELCTVVDMTILALCMAIASAEPPPATAKKETSILVIHFEATGGASKGGAALVAGAGLFSAALFGGLAASFFIP